MPKKILLTGGTGSIGKAFISRFHQEYDLYNISRGGERLVVLDREFPSGPNGGVHNFMGSIEDVSFLRKVFRKVRPDIVIHFSAIKHVDFAEKNPIPTCKTNVLGSLNIIESSIIENVPTTIGISTDKACYPENVYGYTKALMEKCFIDADNPQNKFLACRFANVAHSSGSVLSIWTELTKQNICLGLTDPKMNRLMFSKNEAVELIHKAIIISEGNEGGIIVSKRMKRVNMLDLAKAISNNIEIVGKRPGERLEEYLIHENESEYVHISDDCILIKKEKNENGNEMPEGHSTLNAQQMTEQEIKQLIDLNR